MGTDSEQAARALLHHHARRPPATRRGTSGILRSVRRHPPRHGFRVNDTRSASRTLADVYTATAFSALPRSAVADAQRAVLDWLGSAMAGGLERPARMAQQVVAALGSSDEVIVFGERRSSAGGGAPAHGGEP